MARQIGILPLEGTIDNITFYRTRDGYLVKKKTHISADRIRTEEKFKRTRENADEMKTANAGATVILRAMQDAAYNSKDYRVFSRLISVASKILRTDVVNVRGTRTVADGNLSMLQGFDYNSRATLASILIVNFGTTYDRVTGEVTLNLPAYVPKQRVKAPSGATDYRIILAASELDFAGEQAEAVTVASAYLKIDLNPTTPLTQTVTLPAGSTKPVIIAVGMEFFQELGAIKYPLMDGSHNCLSIVKVDS